MNFIIKEIPAQPVVYMRRTGAYGEENYKLMCALKDWAAARNLLSGSVIYGVAHDGPDTPPQKCRYDVCLAVSADFPEDTAVQRGAIAGGKYAVFQVCHTRESVTALWHDLPAIIMQAGVQLDDARPILERYQYEVVQHGQCEFYVPLQ